MSCDLCEAEGKMSKGQKKIALESTRLTSLPKVMDIEPGRRDGWHGRDQNQIWKIITQKIMNVQFNWFP